MSNSTYDYCIVGAGLAGCFIAHELAKRGRTFIIYDIPHKSASAISAGLINPITGKRFGYIAEYDQYFNNAILFYKQIKGAIATTELFRLLTKEDECKFWNKKKDDEFIQAHSIPIVLDSYDWTAYITKPDIALKVKHGAQINIATVLDYFHGLYREHIHYYQFDESNRISENVTAKFGAIIYAEGWNLQRNPLWNYIDTMFAKGQILSIEVEIPDSVVLPLIISGGKYISHQRGNIYRFGANYNWDEINDEVTDEATSLLLEEVQQILTVPIKVNGAKAGVRPIVRDMQPVMGKHPEQENTYILNGLGSKGALLAPNLSVMLIDYVESGMISKNEYNVERFSSRYFSNVNP